MGNGHHAVIHIRHCGVLGWVGTALEVLLGMVFSVKKGVFRSLAAVVAEVNSVKGGKARGIGYELGLHGRKRHLTFHLSPNTRRNINNQTGRRNFREDSGKASSSVQNDGILCSPLRHWLNKQGIPASTRLSDEALEALESLGIETEEHLLSFSAADLEAVEEIIDDDEVQAVRDIVAELRKREESEEAQKHHQWIVPCVSVDPKTGDSFFTEKRFDISTPSFHSILSRMLDTSGILFRETPSHYCFDWHFTSKRQLIVNLDAGVEIEVSNGARRLFQAGSVVFLEDTWGRGHRSRAVDGRPRKSIVIYMQDDELL